MRKVLLRASTLGDNVASFVNQTARRLHIRKEVLGLSANAATAAGDAAILSMDEVPVNQVQTNDSRSHIDHVSWSGGATGDTKGSNGRAVLNWNRDDFVLDPDEAIFMNVLDITGAPPLNATANLWYQD